MALQHSSRCILQCPNGPPQRFQESQSKRQFFAADRYSPLQILSRKLAEEHFTSKLWQKGNASDFEITRNFPATYTSTNSQAVSIPPDVHLRGIGRASYDGS